MRLGFLSLFFSVLAGASLAEVPSLDSEAKTYVDDRGCVFVRVIVQGWTLWVQQRGGEETGCAAKPLGKMI